MEYILNEVIRRSKGNDDFNESDDDSSKIPSSDNNPYDSDNSGDSSSDESTDLDVETNFDLTNQQGLYRIVDETEVNACQNQDISNLSTTWCITWAEARASLVYCRWNLLEATEGWCKDEEEFRQEVGLGERNMDTDSSSSDDDDEPVASVVTYLVCEKCSIEFESFKDYSICNHKFCKPCWTEYIGESIRRNVKSSLVLRCPHRDCLSVVNKDLVDLLAPEAEWNLYDEAYLKSYFAENPKGKWCPTQDCKHAVLVNPGCSITKFTCRCCQTYCYKCLKEAHDPIPCSMVDRWMMETWKQMPNWHVANKRWCPQCERALNLNGEHKRLYCRACDFHFCRTCLHSWLDNGHWLGDQYFHICPDVDIREIAEIEAIRARCKLSVDKHKNFHSQWRSLHQDQVVTISIIVDLKNTGKLNFLADKQGLPLEEISFVADAWLQVADCKRVLKWTCVYEYYFIAMNDSGKALFDYLRDLGNMVLDSLCSHLAVMSTFFIEEQPAEPFEVFRGRVCQKLSVARNFFENMVLAFKEHYFDMETLRRMICLRRNIARRPSANDPGTSRTNDPEASSSSQTQVIPAHARNDWWVCQHCWFHNDYTVFMCIMCYQQ